MLLAFFGIKKLRITQTVDLFLQSIFLSIENRQYLLATECSYLNTFFIFPLLLLSCQPTCLLLTPNFSVYTDTKILAMVRNNCYLSYLTPKLYYFLLGFFTHCYKNLPPVFSNKYYR